MVSHIEPTFNTNSIEILIVQSASENLTAKIKGHGSDLEEALAALDDNISKFQVEVEVCAQQRMGRIEYNGNTTNMMLASLKKNIEGESHVRESDGCI